MMMRVVFGLRRLSSSSSSIGSVRKATVASARSLPTRHSRHLPPPMAQSLEEALELHKNLVEKPSSWYTYPTSFLKETDDSWLVQQLADPFLQQVEYTLRGISSTLPHSIHSTTTTVDDTSTVQERVEQMIALLERAEHESQVMCELRANYKSQISTSSPSSEEGEEDSAEWRRLKIQQSFGIHPGLSIDMYDIVLDAIAASASSLPENKAPSMAHDILLRVLDKTEQNTIMMVPTPLTFNAVLRAVASSSSIQKGQEEVLLDCATSTFTRMPQPNAASYTYMMQIIGNTLPERKSRANMLYGLYTQACRDGVVSPQLQTTLQNTIQFDSDYHAFFQKDENKIIPQKYTRNVKQYSYSNDSNSTY